MPYISPCLAVLVTLAMAFVAGVCTIAGAQEKKPPAAALDAYGDPLPAGALARLGTTRFRHGASVTELGLSPDGKILATSSSTGGISLWDMDSGRELWRHKAYQHVTFSPDGKLAAADGDKVTVWDAATGKELYHLKDLGAYETFVFSPDRKWLACAGPNHGAVCLWDAASGKKVFLGHDDIVRYAAFSRDGKRLASSSADGTIRVWDPAAPRELQRFTLRPHEKHEKPVFLIPDVAFTPDGKSLAVWGYDEKLQVRDAATGKVQRVLGDKQDIIGRVAFSPDGALMAWTTQNTTHLWDVATWKPVRQWPSPSCRALTFSPDGKTLVAGCGESRPRFWDVASGQELRTFAGHRRQVLALSFSDEGQRLFSGSSDASFCVWDWRVAREEAVWQLSRSDLMSISRDGRKGAVASIAGKKVNIWDFQTGTVQALHPVSAVLRQPVLSDNGKLVAWYDWHRTIHLWNTAEQRELHRFAGIGNDSGCMVFSPGGKWLLFADVLGEGPDSEIRIIDTKSGRELRRLPTEGNLLNMAFAPDARVWATATFDLGHEGKVRLWDAATFREIGFLGRFDGHPWLHFSPDSRFLVLTGVWPDHARVLEVATGRDVLRFDGSQAGIESVAFSRDHRLFATAGRNSTILVWDLTRRMKNGKFHESELNPKELGALWAELGGADSLKAQDAVWKLVGAPAQAVPFMQQRLKAIAPADSARLDKLLQDLGDKRFAVRIEATRELEKLGELAEGALRRVLKTGPSLEVHQRVEQILSRMHKYPLTDPELLQAVRGVQVLEYIGTREARRHLEKLSEGLQEARLTQEAQLALARLGKEKSGPPKKPRKGKD
jgi:WD40 repeat protein